MQAHIIVGMGFGDEGKGNITRHIAKNCNNPIIVRYCGGHQAGHTIKKEDGTRHVCQSFGSGVFENVPTFWSKYCCMFPIGFIREYNDLKKIGITPTIYFDPEAVVTTIYDVLCNQAQEQKRNNKHGSVGVGIGTTFERHNNTPYKLFFHDLYCKTILQHKLGLIKEYYHNKFIVNGYEWNEAIINDGEMLFEQCVNLITEADMRLTEQMLFTDRYSDVIFEGAQGILLDQTHGFFPYVTRGDTTSKNAIAMIMNNQNAFNALDSQVNINYVSRIYLTRHGEGPFPTEGIVDHINCIIDKTNYNNAWQHDFRFGCFDMELIKYALECDTFNLLKGVYNFKQTVQLNLTCLDHLKDINQIKIKQLNGDIVTLTLKEFLDELHKITGHCPIYTSYSPYSEFKKIL